jgi:hypothetical protein
MERICSVCGGETKALFSSTYCPRCEGDERPPPGGWLSVTAAVDQIGSRVSPCGVCQDGSLIRSPYRDVVSAVFKRQLTNGMYEYFDVHLSGKGAPQVVVDYWVSLMGGA